MSQDFEKLDLAKVDWASVLPRYLDKKHLTGKWGPCPLCGGGDSFKIFDSPEKPQGSYKCFKCNGGGDFLSLIHEYTDRSYKDLFAELRGGAYQPVSPSKPRKKVTTSTNEKSPEEKRRDLQVAWDGAGLVTDDSPVWRYLSGRIPGLKVEWIGPDVRFHPGMKYVGHDGKTKGFFPVMLQRARARDGKPRTLHRTFLTPDGVKVPFKCAKGKPRAKLQMPSPEGPMGGSIRLNTAVSRTLALVEGSETGYAVVARYENRIEVRSMLDCINLGKADIDWSNYDLVMIFADRDQVDERLEKERVAAAKAADAKDFTSSRPGEHYAEVIAATIRAEGPRCVITASVVEGVDYCDIWAKQYAKRQEREAAREARRKARDEARQRIAEVKRAA